MRSLALSLTLFALPAAAGTVTAQGEVRALNHADDILNGRPLGTADWTSYCGNGQRNDTYAADGLTLHNGDIQRVRPGLYHGQNQLVRGNLARPMCRPNPGNYFPNTSAGGVAAGNTIWFCPMGTFDRPVNQIGLTAGRNGTQYLVAFNAEATGSRSNTSVLFALQVTHQSAVTSTNTV